MKKFLSVGFVMIFCVVASGAITIDGSISDWNSKYIFEDPDDDGAGEAEMTRWGCFIDGSLTSGTLYAFFEMDTTIATYMQSTNDVWAGIHINADLAGGVETGTGSVHEYTSYDTDDSAIYYGAWSYSSGGWNDCAGLDINVEIGLNEAHWGEGFNFWGKNDCADNQGSAVVNGEVDYAGNIIEFSCPISEITAELAYDYDPDDDVTPKYVWQVGARTEASIDGDGPWGGDYADGVKYGIMSYEGDFNGDGAVDVSDLGILATNYGKSSDAFYIEGDANQDGAVDVSDLGILATNYGSTSSGAPIDLVPEPATLSLLGLGVFALVRRKK